MIPQLKFNCPEKWENMKVGMLSRHCGGCNKAVHDFTNMSKEELILFLLQRRDQQICGRVKQSQLDYHHKELEVIIERLIKTNKNTNMAFFLLSVGSMALLGCDNKQETIKQFQAVSANSSLDTLSEVNNESINQTPNDNKDSLSPIVIDDYTIVGEIIETPSYFKESHEPYCIVEIMPEFIGGEANLITYLHSETNYPDWEKSNKISGTVYVSFVIDKEGDIKDAKIVRSVTGSKNFDAEVLRVINGMPCWKPGEQSGKKVDVQFTLPVTFKL